MNQAQLHPQFLTDENGNKKSVLLPIEEFYELLEDLDDLAVMAKRKDEPTSSMEELLQDLGIDNLV